MNDLICNAQSSNFSGIGLFKRKNNLSLYISIYLIFSGKIGLFRRRDLTLVNKLID